MQTDIRFVSRHKPSDPATPSLARLNKLNDRAELLLPAFLRCRRMLAQAYETVLSRSNHALFGHVRRFLQQQSNSSTGPVRRIRCLVINSRLADLDRDLMCRQLQFEALKKGAAIMACTSRVTDAAWDIISDAIDQLNTFRHELTTKFTRKSRLHLVDRSHRVDQETRTAVEGLAIAYYAILQTFHTLQLTGDAVLANINVTLEEQPALTIMVQNAEELSAKTLADLTAILSTYDLSPIQLSLIFVVSSAAGVPVLFAEGVFSALDVSEVVTVTAAECYSNFVQEMLTGGMPVRLPIEAIQLLNDRFITANYCVKTVQSDLDLLLAAHFRRPASVLCMQGDKEWIKAMRLQPNSAMRNSVFDWIAPDELKAIPSLQGHRDWIKERNHEAMDVALQAAKDRHVIDAAAYRCLSAALDLCLSPEERRRFSSYALWEELFSSDGTQFGPLITEAFDMLPSAFSRSSVRTMIDLSSEWQQALTGYDIKTEAYHKQLFAVWTEFHKGYMDLLWEAFKMVADVHLLPTEPLHRQPMYMLYLQSQQAEDSSTGPARPSSRGAQLQELTSQRKAAAPAQPAENLGPEILQKLSEFDDFYAYLCAELKDWLLQTVKACIQTPRDIPFHEVLEMSSDAIREVREYIDSNIRLNVATSLVRPAVPKKRAVPESVQRLAMTYRLLLQCDKAASTFDWLDAFIQHNASQSGKKRKPSGNDAEQEQKEIQCGLYASIKDLASVGVLRATNGMSKVQRLLYAWTDDYVPSAPARVDWYAKDPRTISS